MAIIFLNKQTELKDFIIDFIKANIPDYRLDKISNGNAPEVPNITDVHPLVLEVANMGVNGDNQYDSILPAISIESTITSVEELRVLGSGSYDIFKVDQDFINCLIPTDYSGTDKMQERLRRGLIITDEMVTEIQTLYDAKKLEGKDLWFKKYEKSVKEVLNISLWTDNSTIRDILLMIVDSLIERSRTSIKEELAPNRNFSPKGIKLEWQAGLYNLETYGRIFYGAEGNLNFLNSFSTIIIDETINDTKIEGIEETIKTKIQIGNEFVAVNENN